MLIPKLLDVDYLFYFIYNFLKESTDLFKNLTNKKKLEIAVTYK